MTEAIAIHNLGKSVVELSIELKLFDPASVRVLVNGERNSLLRAGVKMDRMNFCVELAVARANEGVLKYASEILNPKAPQEALKVNVKRPVTPRAIVHEEAPAVKKPRTITVPPPPLIPPKQPKKQNPLTVPPPPPPLVPPKQPKARLIPDLPPARELFVVDDEGPIIDKWISECLEKTTTPMISAEDLLENYMQWRQRNNKDVTRQTTAATFDYTLGKHKIMSHREGKKKRLYCVIFKQ